jgi:zinc protease
MRYLGTAQAVTVRLGAGQAAARAQGRPARAQASRSPPQPRSAGVPRFRPLPEPPAGLGAAGANQAPPLQETVLANGLRVAAARSGRAPLATAVLLLPEGSGLDQPGEGPLTQLAAEQAVFGCRGGVQDMAGAFDRLGLVAAVDVDERATRLSLTGLSASLRPGLDLLAQCLRAPMPSADNFRRIRQDLAAHDPSDQDDLDLVADRALGRLVFGDAPPRAGTKGRREATPAQVLQRRQRLMRANGAVLILTGDVDPSTVFGWAKQLFGGWPDEAASPKPPDRTPPEQSPVLVVDAPGYPLALVAVGARAPGPADPARAAFEVADSALGGSYTSRLSESLRVRRGLTYDVTSRIDWRPRAGLFTARASVDPSVAPEAAALMAQEIGKLARTGPSPKELAKDRALAAAGVADASETTEGLAQLLADEAARGERMGAAFEDPARLAAVAPADVQRAAARLADAGAMRIVIVADVRRLPPAFTRRLPASSVVHARALLEGEASKADLGDRPGRRRVAR